MSDTHKDWPQTLEEAVERIVTGMSKEDKTKVRGMPHDELSDYHFTWGMGIRNGFGLNQGNEALLQSCAYAHAPERVFIHEGKIVFFEPDTASAVIMEAVWKRLQAA